MQELRPYLHSHRAWLSGLWTASGGSGSLEGRKEHAALLSQLLGSLLKICDPEVLHILDSQPPMHLEGPDKCATSRRQCLCLA